jgi:RNA polymerase sigma factor (sigma-70 family)
VSGVELPAVSVVELPPKIEGMIVNLAKGLEKRANAITTRDDLISIGRWTAMQLVPQWRPGRARLTIFLSQRVKGAMLDEIKRTNPYARSYWAAMKRTGTVRLIGSLWQLVHPHEGKPFDMEDRRVADPSEKAHIDSWWEATLRPLAARERDIFTRYFREGRTMNAIAGEIGLSKSRVSQMVTAALAWLRRARFVKADF